MARYRKISVQIWSDERFLGMSDAGKLAFLFVLTHPNLTSFGAMRATIPGLAAELRWTEEALREALREALNKGMVKVDEKHLFLCLPKFLKHNRPESPNVVAGWGKAVELLPQCELQRSYFKEVAEYTEGFGEAFAKALPEDFRQPWPNQEQEQEQELIPPLSPKGEREIRCRESESPKAEGSTVQAEVAVPATGLVPAADPQASAAAAAVEGVEGVEADGPPREKPEPPGFTAFWAAWPSHPRKVGKSKCLALWRRARLENRHQVIVASVLEHTRCPQWVRDQGQFIPEPLTWLNKEGWMAPLTLAMPSQQSRPSAYRKYAKE